MYIHHQPLELQPCLRAGNADQALR